MTAIADRHRRIASAIANGLTHVPRLSQSLVELKRGGSRTLFLVHDGDGQTLVYLNLAQRLPRSSSLSVVGIEPLRLPGVPLAHPSIEEMAACYIEEVRRLQPHGPYLLGGLCAGGTIAFEMARQLLRAGDRVACLFILDAVAPGTPRRQGLAEQRLGRLMHTLTDDGARSSRLARAWAVSRIVARKLVNTVSWEIANRPVTWSVAIRYTVLRLLRARGRGWPRFLPPLSVRQIYLSADARYVPGRLSDSSVVLLRARAGVGDDQPYCEIYADDTLGWGRYADNLTIIDVDGGHSSMLQEPRVQGLAAAMASAVAAATESAE